MQSIWDDAYDMKLTVCAAARIRYTPLKNFIFNSWTSSRWRSPALLILGNEIVEGIIRHFSADAVMGYEVTIEYLDLSEIEMPFDPE